MCHFLCTTSDRGKCGIRRDIKRFSFPYLYQKLNPITIYNHLLTYATRRRCHRIHWVRVPQVEGEKNVGWQCSPAAAHVWVSPWNDIDWMQIDMHTLNALLFYSTVPLHYCHSVPLSVSDSRDFRGNAQKKTPAIFAPTLRRRSWVFTRGDCQFKNNNNTASLIGD